MLRTSSQRKALCTVCPIARTADLIGDTCSILIVRELMTGPKRFGELGETLTVSTRTLTLKLHMLKKCGFVAHKDGKPYALTKKGRALKPILNSLKHYGEKYL